MEENLNKFTRVFKALVRFFHSQVSYRTGEYKYVGLQLRCAIRENYQWLKLNQNRNFISF